VQQELIAEMHRISIWPVVVTVDGNISIHDKTNFINGDGSYILLIPDGNINSLLVEIIGLIGGNDEGVRFWNSETRFVVAGANNFSMLQQTAIFDLFSKLRLYNCIIISQEYNVIDKEYSKSRNGNDLDTGMKFGVYTWFPYQSSDRCTEVNDIRKLDTWVVSAQGHFSKNTDLFPIKIRKSFNRCPMKAVVRDAGGFITTQYVKGKDSTGSDIKGMEMDLLRIILEQMNMTFIHVPTPYGFEFGNNLLDNLTTAMIAKEAYIALGSLTRICFTCTFYDFTNTHFTATIRWYVPCSVKYSRWSSLFRILSVELWLVLIISIVIAAITTTLIGRYSGTSEWQSYKTLTSSLINIWAVILGVSVSTMPRTPSLRSLFLAWVCFSVAFSTVFQAFLTTFLIDSGYKTPIQNMDELFASGIKLAFEGKNFWIGDEKEVSEVQRRRVNCPSYWGCVEWAKNQKNISVSVLDINAEFRYAIGDFIGENSKPLLCRLEDGVIFPVSYTMLMIHGDPLMRRVNEIINRVVEAGLYNHWVSLEFNRRKIYFRKIGIVQQLDGYYSFNLYHMQTAFYLILMGWFLSALCFMIEVLYNWVSSRIM
jgi:hypothetical protein